MNIVKAMQFVVRHVTIVLALVFLALVVLDWLNPLMGFIANPAAVPLLVAFCLVALYTSLFCTGEVQRERRGGSRGVRGDRRS